ncbi:CRISPR-associated endonuclease Csn1 [Algoriphagus sp. 4150]|uniref:type II CRISPR RNA-guided endonuclease Cas9 n=1 Tax=Algoriphagus sp. 4150 TaxID=2817756 RepID=UPI002854C7A9|nr:type II CRISPR RNA-guided endonuclease Cas9 [Algoriphagus sp. 4150]MDR7130781.1 CRISPR-associated endonuclease Csn1 [Algoriphagus sp. 4150]
MEKIFGIDLGTNSIGTVLREGSEFPWYGVYTFKKGVGEGKAGEYSFAAERTSNRSSRRLYNARRYRKWATLEFLIKNHYCPLSIDKLNKWKHYSKDVGRKYPVEDESFQSWIKLDFDQDGEPDYSSPYQLRRELINLKLDLSHNVNRYKVGRALFHIAQRRGFKSSRKSGASEKVAIFNGSTETKTIGRNEYEQLIIDHNSLGAAFAFLEDSGIRIRNRYTLRSDYEKEVGLICQVQGLDVEGFKESIKKAIFFQRPLRSQKGLVGKCTLEPQKSRCPISHPAFEEFRAWSFLNNIKYYDAESGKMESLPLELKLTLFEDKFFPKGKNDFKFSQINKHLQKVTNKKWKLNYKDEATVPACPVSARLRSIFGENWMNISVSKNIIKYGKPKVITYSIEDVWHILFTYEDEEILEEFFVANFDLNESQVDELKKLWNSFPVGYASLSLKAINSILPFLRDGLIYTEAVLLAKIPDVIGTKMFDQHQVFIKERIKSAIEENRKEKKVIAITNKLISDYHLSDYKQGYRNPAYTIDQDDIKDIEKAILGHFGTEAWKKELEKDYYLDKVKEYYQSFFNSKDRKHFGLPHLLDQIKDVLLDEFHVESKQVTKLYHPSQIDIYPPAKRSKDENIYLPNPKTGAFKNPMAYKTLFELRRVMNHLIEKGEIDEDTRIVVEIARELNDANKRWAIETYQRNRENENREIAFAISQLLKDPDFKGNVDPNNHTDKDKLRLWTEQSADPNEFWKEVFTTKDDVKKYRLWKEQDCKCIYTGKLIPFTTLFDENVIDFEHTIPRSKSFDNSLANLTVCYAHYNRNVKKNFLPVELPNYESDTTEGYAIRPQLIIWEKRVDSIYKLIEAAKSRSKGAMDKTQKDDAIRKRHMLQMEYDYWKNKLDRFTRTDISTGFKNSQLIDSQIISKYAFHYLKTVFNRVDVQKGTVTSLFRKIYGIQPKDEIKDRGKHHHHAVDAAVLTLIPKAAEREAILKKYFEDLESNQKKDYPIVPFDGFNHKMLEELKDMILINNIPNKDQAFAPGKKLVRKRGRVVWLRDKEGNLILDKKNNKIPKVMQGDSVRGQLHLDTFYGKIKAVKRDKNGAPQRDDQGKFLYNKINGKDEMWIVGRKSITDLKIGNDLIIDPYLEKHLQNQLSNGVSLSELKDFNGKIIRRIRVRVKAGRGFLDADKVTELKEQTYKSKYEYKNNYYTNSGDNYAFGYYEGRELRKIIPINLLEASKVGKLNGSYKLEDLFEKTLVLGSGKKQEEVNLYHVFQVGQRVLIYFTDKLELKNLGKPEISQRLYFLKKLADANQSKIQFQHHLEARDDQQLLIDFPKDSFGTKGKDGFSSISPDFIAPKLLLTPSNYNFIIEGKDFDLSLDGEVKYKF